MTEHVRSETLLSAVSSMDRFLPASRLGLEERHRVALILVLEAHERGELRDVDYGNVNALLPNSVTAKFSGNFSMTTWMRSYECGTICCIGGTAELLGCLERGELKRLVDGDSGHVLFDLFYPDRIGCYGLAEAMRVLEGFLMRGVVEWEI
jgi:hypothetical protein